MSMEHKAFVFDHNRFHAELHDALVGALRTEDATPLRDFIEKHRDELTDHISPGSAQRCARCSSRQRAAVSASTSHSRSRTGIRCWKPGRQHR